MLIPKELEPEQNTIRTIMSNPDSPAELILVQGVAGAGKTVLGLFTLLDIITTGRHLLESSEVTPVFITYNELLLEECYNSLLKDQRLAPVLRSWISLGEPRPYRVNFLTFQQLCRFLAPLELRDRVIEDRDAIAYVADIAVSRGFGDMPPEQVFAQLSCLLKGHPHLQGMNIQEMEDEISNAWGRDELLTLFGGELIRIKRFIQGEYRDRLGNQLDRADLAMEVLKELRSDEEQLEALMKLEAGDVRKRLTAGQWGAEFEWLKRLTEALSPTDPEQEVREFVEITNPIVRNREMPSNREWARIQELLVPVLVKRGFRGTRAFNALGALLPKPFFIVDEIHDLSLIESELLISLYFHLERGRYSRLVALGDLNQQMMPTGFRWEDLIGQFKHRWRNLGLGRSNAPFIIQWTDSHYDHRSPFRRLLNNYRTSEEIAVFARSVAERLVNRMAGNLPQPFQQNFVARFNDNLIDPDRSIPFEAAELYDSLPPEQRLVWIIVADRDVIVRALKGYRAQGGPDERLVLIVHDSELLQRLMEPALFQQLDQHVRVYEAIWSKGLEFVGCAVAGVPMGVFGDSITVDQIGQFYTSITRPQIKLRLLITPEEWEAAGKLLGDISQGQVTIFNISEVGEDEEDQVNELLRILQELGPASVPLPARIRYAEQMEFRFRGEHKEEYIITAISEAEAIGESGRANRYRELAAETFEKDEEWRLALRYYGALGDDIGRIRCLFRLSRDDRESEEERNRARREAERLCERFEETEQWGKAAEGWKILQEFEKAISAYIEHGRKWWSDLRSGVASRLAVLVEDPLGKAEGLITGLSEENLRSKCIAIADEYRKRETDEELIKAYLLLKGYGFKEESSRLLEDWIRSRRYNLLVRALADSEDRDEISAYAHRLRISEQPPQWEWSAGLYVKAISLTDAGREPERWEGFVREACEIWRQAVRPRQLRIMELLGENLSRYPRSWDRDGIKAWLDHLHNNAGRYKLDGEELSQIDRMIERSQINVVRRYARRIELAICNSEEWLSDLRKYIEGWIGTMTATGILSAQDERIQEVKTLLDKLAGRPIARRVNDPSERLALMADLRSHLLRLTAVVYSDAIVRFVRETVLSSPLRNRNELGCRLLFYTAGRKDEALSLAQRLWRSKRAEERLDALRCWLAMEDRFTARRHLLWEAASLDEEFVNRASEILFPNQQEERERFRHIMDAERLWADAQPDSWPKAMEHWRQAGLVPQAMERLWERTAQRRISSDIIERCLKILWPDQPSKAQEAFTSLSSLPLLLRPEAEALTEITEDDWQEAFGYVINHVRYLLLDEESIDLIIRLLEHARTNLARGDYLGAQSECEFVSKRLGSSHQVLSDYVSKIAEHIAKQGAKTRGEDGR